jgi:hypothetical protein
MVDAFLHIGGKLKAASLDIALEIVIQAGLVNGNFTTIQPRDLFGINVIFSRAIFSASMSTHTTWLPVSAMQAPVTRPT